MGRITSILGEDVFELLPKKLPVPFVRKEKRGYYSVIGNDGSGEVSMLNKTTMQILDLCDGKRTVGEIANSMGALYPDIASDRIAQDVLEAFGKLEDIGVTTFTSIKDEVKEGSASNKVPIVYDDARCFMRLATENDYPLILDYLNEISECSSGDQDAEMIDYVYGDREKSVSQVLLRRELFSFSADYFLIIDQAAPNADASLRGMVKVEYSSDVMRNGAFLTLLHLDTRMVGPVIFCIGEFYSAYKIRNVPALRINILSEAAGSMALINVLSSSGFTLESIQRKEYGLTNSDLAIYVLYFGDADGNYNSK